MYNFVKYIIIAVAMAFTFLMAYGVSNMAQKKIELIPKPEYASVIIQDGRSMCVKNAEMNLIRDWEKKCDRRGDDKNCPLHKEDASALYATMKWYVNNCR